MLLDRTARDVEAGGPAWAILAGHEKDPYRSLLPLRLMGAVHRLVLEGRAPALARYYPSARSDASALPHPIEPEERWPDATIRDEAWAAFRDALVEFHDLLPALIDRTVQTNEVGRCAALLGGFLMVARATGLPLRILEIGASAGLNLRWDHYGYRVGQATWGDARSPVVLADAFVAGRPPLEVGATVVDRAGCDLDPIDPCSAEGQLTLESYLWADQAARLARLRAALAVARRFPVSVEKADAPVWLAAQLAEPRPGTATVVFHSIVMQYLGAERNKRICEVVQEAGARATEPAPLAWLFMEPGGSQADVRLTLWPGGREELIARAGYHGHEISWLAV